MDRQHGCRSWCRVILIMATLPLASTDLRGQRVRSQTDGVSAATAPGGEVLFEADVDAAEIRVDGRLVGHTSTRMPLAAGEHQVQLSKPGHQVWRNAVVAAAGGQQRVFGTLPREIASNSQVAATSPVRSRWTRSRLALLVVPVLLIGLLVWISVIRSRRSVVGRRLTLSAAASWKDGDPLDSNWVHWTREIVVRRAILDKLEGGLNADSGVSGCDSCDGSLANQRVRRRNRRLAATDLFVEKAQGFLTQRSDSLHNWGLFFAAAGVVALIAGGWSISNAEVPAVDIPVPAMLVLILRGLAIGGFCVGIAGFFLYLAKAMFHESTQLVSRLHALRFGRLYLYLTSGAIRNFNHLERAFQWSGEFSTAFKDIRHDLPRGALGEVAKAVQSVSEAANAARESKS